MSDPTRLGIVGAGAITQSYIRALDESEIASIVGIADPRMEATEASAEIAGCRAFENYEVMIDSSGCDAVVVCTPPDSHVEIGLSCIDRGLPVLIEKPLATSVGDARALKARADEAGVLVTMASKFRYVEDMIRAKSIINSGMLGEIFSIENAFTARVDMTHRWNSDRSLSGGGVIIDNGTHSVDIVRYLLGPIARVMVVEGKRCQPIEVEDNVTIFAQTDHGVGARIDLSWSIDKNLSDFVTVYGSSGCLNIGWAESKYRLINNGEWVIFGSGYEKLSAFRGKVENFCNVLRGADRPLITSDDAVASVEVIAAVYDSLRLDRWVDVVSATPEIEAAEITSLRVATS